VICLEVAEHVPFEFSDTLVENIVSANPKNLIFTAAPPSQEGINHINLQLPHFWAVRFEQYGYFIDVDLSEKFRQELYGKLKFTPWYLENWLVFRKKDGLSSQELIREHVLTDHYLSVGFKQRIESKLSAMESREVQLSDELDKIRAELESAQARLSSSQEAEASVVKKVEAEKAQLVARQVELESRLAQLESKLGSARNELAAIQIKINTTEHELSGVYNSRGWKLIVTMRRVANALIPDRDMREKIIATLWKIPKTIKNLFTS
jgi:hypothetical protein